MTHRPLYAIANDIINHWPNPYFGAVPYLRAMGELDKITHMYGMDSADDIVRRFLCKASTFRGPEDRRIKAELKEMLK